LKFVLILTGYGNSQHKASSVHSTCYIIKIIVQDWLVTTA